MDISRVAVIGAGTMGASIAVALVNYGYEVILKDVDETALTNGLSRVDKMLQSLVKKGLPMTEADKRKKLISTTTEYQGLAKVDLVVEAVLEKIDVKVEVFRQLERYCRPDAILASNTSSLSITEIAASLDHKERVIGLHFFNPANIMKLVEVIPGLETSAETVSRCLKFGQSLDKLAIRVEECPSFLVNRLLGRYMGEALWCLEESIATIEEIDKAATDLVMPIGPLALRDMNGADIGLAVAQFNFQEYGERFRPASILESMVKNNWLGQKTGKGFYIYEAETRKRQGVNEELLSLIKAKNNGFAAKFQAERLFLPMINEAFIALQEQVCAVEDLDPALMAGLGMRKGPLALAEDIGLRNCLSELESLFKTYGERFRPAPLLKRYVRAGRKQIIARDFHSVKEPLLR